MSELRLFAGRSGLNEGTPWVLLDGSGEVQIDGYGIAAAPKADHILIVVPDDCVSVFSLPLPDLPQKRLKQALPTIIEDHLLTATEATETTLISPPVDGVGTLAAFNRDWMAALLAAPSIARCPTVRVVAESWALPRLKSRLSLYLGPERIVLALHDWTVAMEPTPAGTAKPEAVLFALRQVIGGDGKVAAINCFYAPGSSGQPPAWLNEFAIPVDAGGIFDWRTAAFAAAPSLHVRQRMAFPLAAAIQALKPAAAILVILMALEILAAGVAVGRLAIENADLKAQQVAMFRSLMGPDAALVDGERQLMQRLATHRTAAGQAEPSDLLVLMSRIAEKSGSAPALDELVFQSGALSLQLKTREDQVAWLDLIKATDLAATAEVRDGKQLIRVRP